jgi:hypothetical protein
MMHHMFMPHRSSGRSGYEPPSVALVSEKNFGKCDLCNALLSSTLYKCSTCPNTAFCENCMTKSEDSNLHPQEHIFLRLRSSQVASNERVFMNRSTWAHPKTTCSSCAVSPIVGFRYVCAMCGTSMCERCEQSGVHDISHSLLKMPPPIVKESSAPPASILPIAPKTAAPKKADNKHPPVMPAPTLATFGIDIDTLKTMLKRENDLRLGEAVQEQYRGRGHEAYVEITEDVQRQVHSLCSTLPLTVILMMLCDQVAREFGFSEEEGMTLLQCCESLVTDPHDLAAIREISFYRKYNRMRDGDIDVGDVAPSTLRPLYNLDGSRVQLSELADLLHCESSLQPTGRPTVIFAASHS